MLPKEYSHDGKGDYLNNLDNTDTPAVILDGLKSKLKNSDIHGKES